MLTTLLADGRTFQYYVVASDAAADAGVESRIQVIWLHGSHNVGESPAPLYDAAVGHGIRWIGYDRPGYGKSTENPGRDVASAARDVEMLAGPWRWFNHVVELGTANGMGGAEDALNWIAQTMSTQER